MLLPMLEDDFLQLREMREAAARRFQGCDLIALPPQDEAKQERSCPNLKDQSTGCQPVEIIVNQHPPESRFATVYLERVQKLGSGAADDLSDVIEEPVRFEQRTLIG
jgi:hypothetical protein